ncbi:MAG: 2,3-bisphosphoglycerate-independent phosphoglycerate mutase [Patescibacteria group bacterium]|nr:2,3-bisphosphoglycerate-independent phosphoglycerate mutase [Patescibacteria group bacterium]
MAKKIALMIILDGWGIGKNDDSNPIYVVKPKFAGQLTAHYPVTSLQASGISVGLPWGEVGNSEVGHLTIGAGEVLYQYYPKIIMAIHDGSFFENKALKDAFAHARETGGAVNFAGLLTKANVHASLEHLQALLKMAAQEGCAKINLHLFSDGKDSPPHSLESFLAEVPKEKIATLMGRYYAMDRTGNWRLTETAYRTMLGLSGPLVTDPAAIIERTYKESPTEEFLPPMRFSADKKVQDGDSLIFFNYREDSIRQLASAFILENFNEFPVSSFQNLHVVTMTHYDDAFDVPVAFAADTVENPLGKILSDRGLSQLRLAETYKYAHVTYFFNGLREEPYPNEYRTLVPSREGIHPDEHPEMMAKEVTDRLVEALRSRAFDFILVNYANPDTIAHTANYDAGLEAVRVIDTELQRVLEVVKDDPNVILMVTADHGNAEEMISPSGQPESQHDPSPVPLYIMAPQCKDRRFINQERLGEETLGSLADIAPTLLELMGLQKPPEMTGRSLLDGLI